jgi:tetratricopeptide (TPR) repeat protein
MRRALFACALALAAGCVSALEQGELRYREGDRRGALEVWRAIPEDASDRAAVEARIAAVEEELDRLAVSYVENAIALESEGRLAEAILDFRLALELEPEDEDSLAHVQQLARELASRRVALRSTYEEERAREDLEAARKTLEQLRQLDPFDPTYETEERELRAAIRVEWRRREARIRESLAGEVDGLVEAGRDAFRNEQLETALDLWRRALLIDPENERIQAYISRAERQLESLERLRESDGEEAGG